MRSIRSYQFLRRAQEEGVSLRPDLPFELTDQTEAALIKHLSRFPESIALAGATNRPDIIAEHVYRAASLFTDFYG